MIKNKIMAFVATLMYPETVILSEVSQRKTNIVYHSYMESNFFLKKETNELIYKIEADLQILKINLWLPKGKHSTEE